VRGVFFDLGGTLFSYAGIGRRTGGLLNEAVRRLGGAQLPLEFGTLYRQASRETGVRYADLDYYLHADLFRDTFVRFAELLEVGFDDTVYDWYARAQHEAVVDGLELRADCHATLATLRARGMYLSIVSNIDEDMLQPLVRRERLDDLFHDWTSSEAARSCKPHRRFFEVSLAKAGLAAEEVLFVGDSPEHDVGGAAALGMRTALIVEEGIDPPLQSGRLVPEADHRITRLADLLAIVN
jgi:HAD superfamily hydrolase (TIGR01549 family)